LLGRGSKGGYSSVKEEDDDDSRSAEDNSSMKDVEHRL